MNWEDCVVDVHSVKIIPVVLEEMFQKCGPVRSIIPWKGQNEKPHIFFEYKSPSSADAARTIGLERNDVQVIKILNNEMLKKKFRELAHGPLREHDPRAQIPGRFPQAEKSNCEDIRKVHCLPAKPAPPHNEPMDRTETSYVREIDDVNAWGRSIGRSSSRSSVTNSRSRKLPSRHLHEYQSIERYSRNRTRPDSDEPPTQSLKLPDKPQGPPDKSLNFLYIPHAGEYIKLDLETQLESDPSGIIKMLTIVKGDQKLWMITAAYYKSKRNLDAAKKVLEAGIDMAMRVGVATDTKPFWHLLDQINQTIHSYASYQCPTLPLHSHRAQQKAIVCDSEKDFTGSSQNGCSPLSGKDTSLFISSPPPSAGPCHSSAVAPSTADRRTSRNTNSMLSQVKEISPSEPSFRQVPTGPRIHDETETSLPATRLTSQICDLQKELRILRERQDIVMEELSIVRTAKRRAEESIKEERAVRKKLEKDLRIMEDALSRSKRMENTALDQVKREVEARRQAQSLVEKLKADTLKATVVPPPTPNENSAPALLQLLTLLRSIPPGDQSTSVPQPSTIISSLPSSNGGFKDNELR